MKTKHTPGPWFITKRESWIDVMSNYGDRIVSIDKEDEEHAMPDARLIVSAPDMLELLKDSLEYFEPRSTESVNLQTKIRALIKKATGDE